MSIRKTLATAAVAGVAVFGAAGTASASGAGAVGSAFGSPGLISGNNIQVPINIPLNVCGVGLSVIAALTAADGTVCGNA